MTAVFVSLGRAKPYLFQNLDFAARWAGRDNVVIITDSSDRRLSTKGRVVKLEHLVSTKRKREISEALAACGVNTRWRGGYWVSILLRFEALKAFAGTLDASTPVIHIENDVATFLSSEVLEDVFSRAAEGLLVPPVDREHSCPGIMIAKTPEALAEACEYVVDSVSHGRESSDMYALGSLASQGIVGDLPTRGFNTGGEDASPIVFDSVIVGQYLFGSDPRNSQGISVPGYRYVKAGFDPGRLEGWSLVQGSDGVKRVSAVDCGTRVQFASLHIHAKRLIPDPQYLQMDWDEILSWANVDVRPRLGINVTAVLYSKLYDRLAPIKRKFLARKPPRTK